MSFNKYNSREKSRRYDVDVYCVHNTEGEVTPIRFKFVDDDGVAKAYSIKSYKELTKEGTYTSEDGIFLTTNMVYFECIIIVFSTERHIRLYYNRRSNVWFMMV